MNTDVHAISPVTVVIPCRTEHRWTSLRHAVESARAQVPAPAEIVVVVDHNAALYEKARHELPGVTVLANRFRRGAAGARDTGAFHAITPLIAFLDDDVRAHHGWLAALLTPFADRAVTGTGGAILPAWSGRRPAWFPDELLWTVGATDPAKPAAPTAEVRSAAMAVRRETFIAVGGFGNRDDSAPYGGPAERPGARDAALCRRMAEAGGLWIFVPDARVHHPVTPERMTMRHLLRRCFHAGRIAARSGRGPLRAVLPGTPARPLRALLRGGAPGALRRAGAVAAGATAAAAGGVLELTTRPPAPRPVPVQTQKVTAGVRR
ncbi:glycosyltransferase family 2 protein [Catenuloplanes indicus]|uniref:Glycosyltransferase involved in cell wall biosynthesis n=1 Tax=Catenuloplanes indicus TaxID=137267 RepID=A0AAE4B0D5_9ACTN|nr:glycosyltransferase [Catenuloplanes indicus]MDQ0369452.1 glycosyltransferase involved in cell wall biosynthesis [Catenuloplanes indicus]